MDKRVWTITVQNGWFNGDPPVEVFKVIKLTDNLEYPPGSFLTMETEERRQRGRQRPSEGRLCVKTGEMPAENGGARKQ